MPLVLSLCPRGTTNIAHRGLVSGQRPKAGMVQMANMAVVGKVVVVVVVVVVVAVEVDDRE